MESLEKISLDRIIETGEIPDWDTVPWLFHIPIMRGIHKKYFTPIHKELLYIFADAKIARRYGGRVAGDMLLPQMDCDEWGEGFIYPYLKRVGRMPQRYYTDYNLLISTPTRHFKKPHQP